MSTRPSRRTMLKTAGLAALATPASRVSRVDADGGRRMEPPGERPKICLDAGAGGAPPGASPEETAAASARRIRQLGVEHVISGGGRIPWEETRLRETMDRHKANGLTLARQPLTLAREASNTASPHAGQGGHEPKASPAFGIVSGRGAASRGALEVSSPSDPAEREAERVAEHLVRSSSSAAGAANRGERSPWPGTATQ